MRTIEFHRLVIMDIISGLFPLLILSLIDTIVQFLIAYMQRLTQQNVF